MKMFEFLALYLLFSGVSICPAAAIHWSEQPMPAYAGDVDYVAIGGDGFLYAMSSNANGYVLTSVLDKFRFEMSAGDGFSGKVLAGKDVIYLGAACDAATGRGSGSWTKDSTGLNFMIETTTGERLDFRLLNTGLQPEHIC